MQGLPAEKTTGGGPTLAVATVGQFLAVLSASLVGVALPTIGRELRAGATAQQWVVDAYLLVYASLLVAGGTVADRRGRKAVYLLGLGLFGLGSLAGGLSPSTGWLVAARALQGIGPALVAPAGLALLTAANPDPRRRAAALGVWSAASGLALALGPIIGGSIVDGLGWRWVFLLNVPLVAGLICVGLAAVPSGGRLVAPPPFDGPGLLLTVAVFGGPSFAVIEGQVRGWSSAVVLAGFALGAVAVGVFVARERRLPYPLVDVRLFARPAFLAANVAGLTVFFALIGGVVYLSAFFQLVQGRSPVQAGLDLLPLGAGLAVMAPVTGRLVGRIGPRLPLFGGLALGGVALLGLVRMQPTTGASAVWWDLALAGAGAGLSLTPMTAIAVAAVPPQRAGMAAGVLNAVRQFGQVLGVAVLGALVGGRLAGGPLDAAGRADFTRGLHAALVVAGLALLVGAACVAALVPSPRRSLRPGPPVRAPG